MIQVKNITKSFGSLQVLKGVNMQIDKGEIVSIVGASGAGKTTLLQIAGTLSQPDTGEIWIDNTNVSALNDWNLSLFRNQKIGFVFQFHQLLPEFTALENACIPAFIKGTDRKTAQKQALELFDFLDIKDRISHKPSELSGGEQQRVAIARALINNPAVILADEPSGNLDSQNAKELHKLFFSLREKFQQTFIIVTHNEELANMTDRKLVMKDGVFVS